MEKKTIKIGDTVMWRGGFGQEAPLPAKVVGMQCSYPTPHRKYGREVDEVETWLVEGDYVVFTLDNGKWAYGRQIDV